MCKEESSLGMRLKPCQVLSKNSCNLKKTSKHIQPISHPPHERIKTFLIKIKSTVTPILQRGSVGFIGLEAVPKNDVTYRIHGLISFKRILHIKCMFLSGFCTCKFSTRINT